MKQVLSLTGFNQTASSRFRIRQYSKYFKELNIEINDRGLGNRNLIKRVLLRLSICGFFDFRKILRHSFHKKPDLLLAERQYFSIKEVLQYSCPKIFTIDDLDFPKTNWLKYFDAFITSNHLLQKDLEHRLGPIKPYKILVLPTVVDTNKFKPINSTNTKEFVIVWSGYAKNFKYFDELGSSLYKFMNDYPNTKLRIISETIPNIKKININQIEWIKWNTKSEALGLAGADIGIMPLFSSKYEMRKAGFKIIQYLATNIPAVASPVGVNKDILSFFSKSEPCLPSKPNDWYSSLLFYYKKKFVDNNKLKPPIYRKYIIKNYSIEKAGPLFAQFIHKWTCKKNSKNL